jgi:hypothetical protein
VVGRELANGNVTNYGGIVYLDVLCSSTYGFGVSNIYGNVTYPYSGYIWDFDVTTHEMGHNFGSPHTHCYSPPIDMCYNGESGCYSGPVVPSLGTIMSYCHLTSAGKSLVFHDRCITVMRAEVDAASCMPVVATVARDTVGVHVASTGLFHLRNAHSAGSADVTYPYGPPGTPWVALCGDWNNDGVDSAACTIRRRVSSICATHSRAARLTTRSRSVQAARVGYR